MTELLLLAVGGGLGAAARWLIDRAVPTPPGGFPLGITIVNVAGSFMLGIVVGAGWVSLGAVNQDVVGIGLLGGFTTFSTWMVDIDRATPAAALVTVIPLVFGVLAAACGVAVGAAVS